ncbi:MAG: ferrochelatase [Verrucomicrobia bacterium]|nr:ferrochelatase [Verrucomicrobiota bacterium]
MPSQAVLLVNLGSPDSPAVPDVRRYLREFLSDRRVMDVPWLIRQFVLNVFILPFRPKKSAEAYQKIWPKDGSPLVVMSKRVQSLLQKKANLPVELAMRYGNPAVPDALQRLIEQKTEEILLIPLFPHYAMSSYETVTEKVREVLTAKAPGVALKILPPFYDDPDYLQSLVAGAREYLKQPYDHLLFSFHGLPERHLKKADISRNHCLRQENCCAVPHLAHQTCYRAQAFKTVEAFVSQAGVSADHYSIAFQSRLGRDPWLGPCTDQELVRFPSRGIKKLLVICPSFVTDCLETLEEIAIRGKENFLAAGGESFTMIPCLNDHPRWMDTLTSYVARLQNGIPSPLVEDG